MYNYFTTFLIAYSIISWTQICINGCVHQLGWIPLPLTERTRKADLVVTAKILDTSPVTVMFYAAKFEVINVLKGWELLKKLHSENRKAIVSLDPKIIAYAKGFGDHHKCLSPVEAGKSYVLFLGYNEHSKGLVAKYDDYFGAADRLRKRTERHILSTLGWEEWSNWSQCSKSCETGIQTRERKCRHSSRDVCKGPNMQKRECNVFSCSGIVDILSFVANYESNFLPPWQRSGEVFTNAVDQKSPSSAPTYLLFPDSLPKNPVFQITFKGPITRPQFLFSIFDANSKMIIGIKVTKHTMHILHTTVSPRSYKKKENIVFEIKFNENIWYNLVLLIGNDALKVKVNCEEFPQAPMEHNIFENVDIFGRMHLGASSDEGDERFVRAKMTRILISSNETFWNQCGKILLDEENAAGESEGSGDDIDNEGADNESGDVDEEYSNSGDSSEDLECACINGGICKNRKCRCPFGWKGSFCEIPLCKNPCLNGGTCVGPNKCACNVANYGHFCQFSQCPLPCKNNGTCVEQNKCKCMAGFTGNQCEQAICSKPCLNGGKCKSNGKCICTEKYEGPQCETKRKCKVYLTKLVSYLRPATVYTYVDEVVPCQPNASIICKRKILQYRQVNQLDYRQEYVCKPGT